MKAAIVTIGDEILIGQIIDTNSGFIAKSLDSVGVQVTEMLSIADDKQQILETFAKLQNNVQIVIITGGLGPTKDDITKKTFCDYFDDQLVMDSNVLNHVTILIEQFFKRQITELNRNQALVPSKATVLFNDFGTAPGLWQQKEDTVFVSLPGVPFEMKHLIENRVIPKVVSDFKRPYIIHRTILTYGIGESLLAETIESWENNLPEFIKLAYLPNVGSVRLRLSARGENKETLETALTENIISLTNIIGKFITGYDDSEIIEVMIGKLLNQKQQTLAVAESCTGGKIASRITAISGSSAYFKGGVVSYATETKIAVLGVDEALVKEHTVYSKEVAIAMAEGVKKLMKSDYGIGTTGIAGPNSDDPNQEIGKVYIAVATPQDTVVEEFSFGKPREKVIDRASNKAFEMLQKEIKKNI